MPAGHSWNLSRWMRALGIKRDDQPDIAHIIQPVTILGDQRAVCAPILPPTAIAGGVRALILAQYNYLQFTSRAPGGSAIRELSLSSAANYVAGARLTLSPTALINQVTPAVQQLAYDVTTSSILIGTNAALPANPETYPSWDMNVVPLLRLIDNFYIRPGYTLEFWASPANINATWSVLFEDLPAQRGSV